MKVTAITPTRDRPQAFRLCERWMARQTRWPDQWLVVDSGEVSPAQCTLGQTHIHHPAAATGSRDLAGKLIRGLHAATGDVIVFIEDDDWYPPNYIERCLQNLSGQAIITGSGQQRHYNLQWRSSRVFTNPSGSCLCSTAIRRELKGLALDAARESFVQDDYLTDRRIWKAVMQQRFSYAQYGVSWFVGIKGLPGTAGLGDGHRPDQRWNPDPHHQRLIQWIGHEDAQTYLSMPVKITSQTLPKTDYASHRPTASTSSRYSRGYPKQRRRYEVTL